MDEAIVIPEIEIVLSVMVSFGFDLSRGTIYIFNEEFILSVFLQFHSSKKIKLLKGDMSLLLNSGIKEIRDHTRKLLANPGKWQKSFHDNLSYIGIGSSKGDHLNMALNLFDHHSCLIILSNQKKESVSFPYSNEAIFSQLVQGGINSYLKSQRLNQMKISVEEANIGNIKANERIKTHQEELDKYNRYLDGDTIYLPGNIKNELWQQELDTYGDAMQHVSQLIKQVALSNSTVLIQGDTGTGKEMVALAVHTASSRRNNILIKINCAALSPTLVESELFGHEKGSFTGAIDKHIGKFELAENGTLFLDEIGEMPLDVQVKVLRAIQEREIERIGGKGPIKVNVRIIAATNRDLHKEVQEGRFRSDLFYRLNVFPITMPRLKDRKEDIEKLANQFIRKYARTSGKNTYTISNKCINQMLQYDWPGNVRELEHLIERSILLTKGTVIKQIDLAMVDRRFSKSKENKEFKTIDENEREHILLALSKTYGKIYGKGGAAELLGIHYSTLNSRMKKLGIQKAVILNN